MLCTHGRRRARPCVLSYCPEGKCGSKGKVDGHVRSRNDVFSSDSTWRVNKIGEIRSLITADKLFYRCVVSCRLVGAWTNRTHRGGCWFVLLRGLLYFTCIHVIPCMPCRLSLEVCGRPIDKSTTTPPRMLRELHEV